MSHHRLREIFHLLNMEQTVTTVLVASVVGRKPAFRPKDVDGVLDHIVLLCSLLFSLSSCMLHSSFNLSENSTNMSSLKLKEYTLWEPFGLKHGGKKWFIFSVYCN